ncbi:MAG: DUF2442 domain-containing protein [Candidatus Tectomicrobia bacterium]|uniref:DUF2442 domain-containing protein n=1 Tax=Tectimicrobiota bacterium TaxID=2528274 RepID=A0A932MQ97_UNCTE|nr:DUF2442 domain-containing protein [Candidatus Tectomicrobia bacterium]
MTHPVHKVTSFEIAGPYRLRVEFADGLSRTIDFRPVLEGELYGPLRDPRVFNAVSLDPEVHTLVWPNGADFDPATLHDWSEHEAAMAALAKRWAISADSGKRAG